MSANSSLDNIPVTERTNILGVGVTATDLEQAVQLSDCLLQSQRRGYVCLTGVHGIMEAQRDRSLKQILNRAFLCAPDGMPTVWIGRLRGQTLMRRVYGPDYMLAICKMSVRHHYRHFLYGGGEGTVARLKKSLESLVPGIQIVGIHTPPFRPLSYTEERDLVTKVSQCRPDIFWVGLSTPKQERFMAQYIGRLDTKLMAGVGAAFDIHAGILNDSPPWVKCCGLQWLHRLIQEPRRLWRRYLCNNPRFVWNVLLQFAGLVDFELKA